MTTDQTGDDAEVDPETDGDDAAVAAYDLDGDGEVSPIEEARAALGVVDARLEQVADDGGVKGTIAGAAHRIVDKLDND
ncbi:MAG: hypothetical protein AAFP84_12050 [Actinomycetota bacterium]